MRLWMAQSESQHEVAPAPCSACAWMSTTRTLPSTLRWSPRLQSTRQRGPRATQHGGAHHGRACVAGRSFHTCFLVETSRSTCPLRERCNDTHTQPSKRYRTTNGPLAHPWSLGGTVSTSPRSPQRAFAFGRDVIGWIASSMAMPWLRDFSVSNPLIARHQSWLP